MILKHMVAFVEGIANTTRNSETQLLENALESFKTFSNGSYPQLIIELEKGNEIERVNNVLSGLGLLKDGSAIEKLTVLKTFADSVLKQEQVLRDKIDEMPSHMTDKTMGLQTATILVLVNDLNTIGGFISDIMLSLAFALSGQDYFNNKRLNQFNKNKYFFKILFLEYKDSLNSKLTVINNVTSTEVKLMEREDMTKVDNTYVNPTNGFVGNPIYHARKAWVDIEIWRINQLKIKKQLFDAKIIELRARQENGDIKDVSKQVDYYQKQIDNIEFKITKLSKV